MKSLIAWLFILSVPLARAVPNLQVYPNSGPTDAKVDEITDIDRFSGYQRETNKVQKQEAEPDPFDLGPYNSEGNYQYIPKVRLQNAQQD